MHSSVGENMQRFRFLAVFVLFSTFGISSTFAEKPTGPKKRFHLYLLIGQSNMAGRGKMTADDKRPYVRVFKFDKANKWTPAMAPLHFDKPRIAGVGPGDSFGKYMAEVNKEVRIGLVPCAVGGTPLKRWVKGGDLYANAIKRAKLAMKQGELKGVIWHQGESDSRTAETANTYGKRLSGMIADLRKDLGIPNLPVVAGELGEFLKPKRLPHFPTVNQAIRDLSKTVPNTASVPSKGLKAKSDGVHFDAASLKRFGRRYGQIMQRLQEKRTTK
jgi:hypothetical protein